MWFLLSDIFGSYFLFVFILKKDFLKSFSKYSCMCLIWVLRTIINIFISASCGFLLTSKEAVLHVEDINNYIEESGNPLQNSDKC